MGLECSSYTCDNLLCALHAVKCDFKNYMGVKKCLRAWYCFSRHSNICPATFLIGCVALRSSVGGKKKKIKKLSLIEQLWDFLETFRKSTIIGGKLSKFEGILLKCITFTAYANNKYELLQSVFSSFRYSVARLGWSLTTYTCNYTISAVLHLKTLRVSLVSARNA